MTQIKNSDDLYSPAFEPKTENRYVAYIKDIPSFIINKVNKPISKLVNGKYVWNDLVVTMYDPIVPSPVQSITDIISKNDFSYFGDIKINVLGPVGDVIDEWTFKNTILKETIFDEFDWSSTEPSKIQLIFSFSEVTYQYGKSDVITMKNG